MKGSSVKLIGIWLVVMVMTVGCAPGAMQPTATLVPTNTPLPPTLAPTDTPAPPTPKPTSPFLGNFPIGSYSNRTVFNCSWRFNANGTYNLDYGFFNDYDLGAFTVSGDQISIKDSSDCDIEGTYTWSYDGNALTFKSLGDPCDVRETIIQKGKWQTVLP
jgi:hypothetical protein